MPSREAFHIGPFQIGSLTIDIPVYWYGIMIMLGVLAASYIAYREAARRREDPEHVWQMFPWVLVAGIVGARIGFIIPNILKPPYSENIWSIFDIRSGGLSIQGAVIGGVVAVVTYCNRSRLSFFKWADIIAPGLALAQAIGRWGNFFNQEAFGQPTTLPWGIPISVQRQQEVAGVDQARNWGPDTRFHPTFAYEMLWDLLNFGLLLWLGRQKRFRLLQGDLLWVYLVVYSVGRFAIEAIRVDSATVSGIAVPQIVALLTILIAWGFFMYRHRPGSTVPVSEENLPVGEVAAVRMEGAHEPGGSRLRRVPVALATKRAGDASPAGTGASPTDVAPVSEQPAG
jgi:phosphatidylglycerol:prolipoprotein diacylglycerol transferase